MCRSLRRHTRLPLSRCSLLGLTTPSFACLSVCLPVRPHVRPAICMFVCLLLTRGCLVLSLLASVLLLLLTVSSFAPARLASQLSNRSSLQLSSLRACLLSRVYPSPSTNNDAQPATDRQRLCWPTTTLEKATVASTQMVCLPVSRCFPLTVPTDETKQVKEPRRPAAVASDKRPMLWGSIRPPTVVASSDPSFSPLLSLFSWRVAST